MSELDKGRVRVAFARAAGTYDAAAVLQREIADRLLARLDVIKHRPRDILDVGSGTGYCAGQLARRYRAHVVALDIAREMLVLAQSRSGWFSRQHFLCADADALPLADDAMDMIFSNLTLQWCDLDRAFPEFVRVLRPGGLLMFTSFGPDTLRELRLAWQQADDRHAHVHGFLDMHDVGDALMRAGFAEPVMDVERVVLTYSAVQDVLRDLKAIGAHNALTARHSGLTGKRRFARFEAAYEAMREDGRIPATYEIVYGHAWAPERKPTSFRRPDGSVGVPLARVKRR